MTTLAVVRVRGIAGVNRDIEYTMNLININRVNHCVVIPENPSTKGMMQVIKDYCTWGEIDKDTLAEMIAARGKFTGDVAVTDALMKENTEYESVDALAQAVIDGKCSIKDIDGLKPVFRLHPPVKGYEGNKRPFISGGALGYRAEKINDLVKRML